MSKPKKQTAAQAAAAATPEAAPAKKKRKQLPARTATKDDFWAFLPTHEYWYMPTRKLWGAATINSILGDQASTIIDLSKPTHEATWCPGLPAVIKNKLVIQSAWVEKEGANTFNLYIPPKPIIGDKDKAGPWREHGEKLWGDDLPHIEKWLAYRVQHPNIKINHGLVTGSPTQGVGKDSFLHPVARAVGSSNFKDISARRAFNDAADKNSFLQAVILRINEVHDLGEKRFAFYDVTKDWMAAPPPTIQVSDKWLVQHPIFNMVGVILTSNHKTDGLYLDSEDRRHYVAWSNVTPADFGGSEVERAAYWNGLWNWYGEPGNRDAGVEHAAAYLATIDVRDFDPKAPPPKTQAWWDIVNANQTPENAELADVLDLMGQDPLGETPTKWPDAITLDMLRHWAGRSVHSELEQWLSDRKNRRAIPHRLERTKYTPVRNDLDKRDGLWMVAGKRETVYARAELSLHARVNAVRGLIAREERKAARRA